MASKIDNRILRVGIQVGDGDVTWYEKEPITAKGNKVSSSMAGDCEITIYGLRAEIRNEILSNTKPLAKKKKTVTVYLEVGRDSYGSSLYFTGQVFRSTVTKKPEIGVQMRCLNGYANKATFVNRTGDQYTNLSAIATQVASDNGVKLSFEISDKKIRSWHYSGSVHAQIEMLEALANAEVYIDNGTLYVKDSGVAPNSAGTVTASVEERNLYAINNTESGIKISMAFNPAVTLGTKVKATSSLDSSLSGTYTIFKLDFDLSNRRGPFILNVEGLPV